MSEESSTAQKSCELGGITRLHLKFLQQPGVVHLLPVKIYNCERYLF